MGYRIHCDWCGEHIGGDDDRAEMPVTIYRRGKRSDLEARWAQETKTTRHFCVAPKPDEDLHHGRDRMGLVPDEDHAEGCYERAIEAITGKELSDPGMGLQWRLVPVATEDADPIETPEAAKPPAPDRAEMRARAAAGTALREAGLISRAQHALWRAGIANLEEAAERGELRLLALDGFGPNSLLKLREALGRYGLELRADVLTPIEFGDRLRDLRGSAGITTSDLAYRLRQKGEDGVYDSTIGSWQRGSAVPNERQLTLIAEALAVEPSALVSKTGCQAAAQRQGGGA